ncbi:hypothetical protein TcCL_NonESM11470, partial [Trypanosoma cruzi]
FPKRPSHPRLRDTSQYNHHMLAHQRCSGEAVPHYPFDPSPRARNLLAAAQADCAFSKRKLPSHRFLQGNSLLFVWLQLAPPSVSVNSRVVTSPKSCPIPCKTKQ